MDSFNSDTSFLVLVLCLGFVSRQTVLIVLGNPKLHGLFSGHVTPYVPLKMPTVFKVESYANKNKRHTTSPRCTEQGKYLFNMVCFTGLAYFLVPQSINRSIFLRKALFIASCSSVRCKAVLSEKCNYCKYRILLNELTFQASPC